MRKRPLPRWSSLAVAALAVGSLSAGPARGSAAPSGPNVAPRQPSVLPLLVPALSPPGHERTPWPGLRYWPRIRAGAGGPRPAPTPRQPGGAPARAVARPVASATPVDPAPVSLVRTPVAPTPAPSSRVRVAVVGHPTAANAGGYAYGSADHTGGFLAPGGT